MKRIVVGVDGSDEAQAGLRWAVEEARLHDCQLHVVLVFEVPLVASLPGAMTTNVPTDILTQQAEGTVNAAVGAVGIEPCADSTSASSGFRISYAALPGHPGHVLIEAANDADLLVVASRGRGGFLGLHLGSVTNYCINHARCPVAVIPVHKAAHGHRHGPLSSVAR